MFANPKISANVINTFFLDHKAIIIDEIALNGLEGIGFDYLWKCVNKRLSCELTPKIKEKFWNFIVKSKSISFYSLPNPLPLVEIYDRFNIVNEEFGQLMDPTEYLDGPYEYCPIKNEHGSCSTYEKRKPIPTDTLEKPYEDVYKTHGNYLVMVASLEERWKALASHLPISTLSCLTSVHYCILELVGKGRENGQMTVGKTNLSKIINESKHLFYNRRHLQQLNLVKTQSITQIFMGKGMKTLMLRLPRFHQPLIKSQPKQGKIFDKIEYLKNQPNLCEINDEMIRKGLLTPSESKRLQKTVNIFKFDERETEVFSKSKKSKGTTKKKYISLQYISEESSNSDEEYSSPELKCQYKVGVSIIRQAYDCFLEAGLKGLTQIEIAQLLGVEFYTCRTICRIFKKRGLVREFLEDKGRQRTARKEEIIGIFTH
ncbi:general transcription factor 3C polypeptide 1 isoform X3 [Leptidea sinapis]|uniref:general transcription factor 3C polypeptide 1 isoform X3 n=1 Tax=Leptidea sinapis TaxID=189913 RepID=UPI0021C3BCA5|nr:general transcription factor 3C polypeptide 1 isoform X3 [Leptidea sinapis]